MMLDKSMLNELRKYEVVFVACSGGLDSMVLLHILHESHLPVHVLHANFQLRGSESDEDEAFILKYCFDHKIPVESKKMDCSLGSSKPEKSIQNIARRLRYDWFEEKLFEQKISVLCTAHHQDDNREQVLSRMLSSGKILDLGGIPERRDRILRPLLHVSKEQIRQYAEQNKLLWREDSSNSKTDYTRNKIRIDLLPLLAEIDSRSEKALDHLSNQVQSLRNEASRILEMEFGENLRRGAFFVPTTFWESQLSLVREVLLEFWRGSGADLAEVERFFQFGELGATHLFKDSYYVLKEKNGLWFANESFALQENIEIDLTQTAENSRFAVQELNSYEPAQMELSSGDLVSIKPVQRGEIVLKTDGKTRKIKRVFNDEGWSYFERKNAKGLYINNVLRLLVSPLVKTEFSFAVSEVNRRVKVIIFPNLVVG